ncbi:hypothetical protein NI17_021810 [Thermobifida halotolerans]|uniref:Uncharacterized protein n=1 Tax=Thermobifida halotolerans TaxID=483545 RepID=A0AA97LW93_9ACTN|nr:hypothetical protein [Thermobifida halotolerans]UOE19338.1 hypothetical protein NI17_021810 [Thermobifida halotolerans]
MPDQSARRSPARTTAALLLTLTTVAVTGVVTLTSVRSYTPSPLERTDAEVVADTLPRLAFVRSALDGGAGADMQALFPEGYFFTHALYGLTWLSVAQRAPERRDEALAEARWTLERLSSPEGTAPFPADAVPAHGVFHAGWSTWLRGRLVAAAGGARAAPEEMAALDAAAEELAAAFETSIADGTPFLSAYPGQAWPVDSVVAMAALRLRDHLAGEDRYALLFRTWMTQVRTRLDPVTGLIPHRVDAVDGRVLQGARATSQSLLLRFLFEIDPEWAAADYTVFRELFASDTAMLPGVREHPRGDDSPGDVDSGPLVLGLSASASTVAIADAVLAGDAPTAAALTGLAEAAGMAVEWGGERRYLGGVLPVGDAFLMWALATTPAVPAHVPAAPAATVSPWWRLPWHALTLLPTAALLWWTVRLWRPPRRPRPAPA